MKAIETRVVDLEKKTALITSQVLDIGEMLKKVLNLLDKIESGLQPRDDRSAFAPQFDSSDEAERLPKLIDEKLKELQARNHEAYDKLLDEYLARKKKRTKGKPKAKPPSNDSDAA
jgi:hypothetical protein